jgi:prenyltransferase beta subunit
MLPLLASILMLAPVVQDGRPEPAPREDWLVRHQEPDGRWDASGFGRLDRDGDPECEPGAPTADLRTTALAMLLLIDQNSDLTSGAYRAEVSRAASWLMAQQADDGLGLAGEAHAYQLRDHALGAVALLELLASSDQPNLRRAAARWVTALELARRKGGGWGATAQLEPDALTTGWALLALRLAQRCGLAVSHRAIREGVDFQRTCFDLERGLVAMHPGGSPTRLAPTALALLVSSPAGRTPELEPWQVRARTALAAAGPSAATGPGPGRVDWESLYLASLASYRMGGREWREWSAGLKTWVQRAKPPGLAPGHHEHGGALATNVWWSLTAATYFRFTRVLLR